MHSGPPEGWHDDRSLRQPQNNDRTSAGRCDCFGLDCQAWLSAPALYMQIGAVEMALKPGVTGADKP